MIEYVEHCIREYKSRPSQLLGPTVTTHNLANALQNDTKFFDCSQLYVHLLDVVNDIYVDPDVPPSVDAVLPAKYVGLYFNNNFEKPNPTTGEKQAEFILSLGPNDHAPIYEKNGDLRLARRNFGAATIVKPHEQLPNFLGQIITTEKNGIESSRFMLDVDVAHTESDIKVAAFWLRIAATALSLINQPRFVKSEPIPLSRQQRRRMKRGMGMAVDAWHRIKWDIDKPVTAKLPYDTNFHKMPLHFRRGHWRKSEADHPKSIQRDNGKWYTWIEGYWAGHPAFGTKKQYWEPVKNEVA
jgi:hypothetical protein